MKTEIRNVYSCDHCRKKYVNIGHAQRHEKKCFRNPANFRACDGCRYLNMIEREFHYDTPFGEMSKTVKVLHCSKLDKLVYPPSVDNKGNYPYEFGDVDNEPMPRVCESKSKDRIDEFDFCAIEVQRQLAKRNTDLP